MKNKILILIVCNILILGALLTYIYTLIEENKQLKSQKPSQTVVYMTSSSGSMEDNNDIVTINQLSEKQKEDLLTEQDSLDIQGQVYLPEKNIYCNTSENQYALNKLLIDNFESDLDAAIKGTDIIPEEYKSALLDYFNADQILPGTDDNPLQQVFYYMEENKDAFIELSNNSDFSTIRDMIAGLELPPNEEAMFILFAYRHALSFEMVSAFLDKCYSYSSQEQEYNYDVLQKELGDL